MIGIAKAISHGGNSIDYALNKENAEVIDKRHVVGDTGKEIKQEFRMTQDLNSRAKNNDLSFVLSPDPTDGVKLSNSQFKAISDDFLTQMGLGKHQAVVIKHIDREHAHLHVYVNRIGFDGKAYDDKFIGKKSQRMADKVAQNKGLIRSSVVEKQVKSATKDVRSKIFDIHQSVLKLKPSSFENYSKLMLEKGVRVQPSINKQSKMQGFRVLFGDHNFKASEIHRNMSLKKMVFKKIQKTLTRSFMI